MPQWLPSQLKALKSTLIGGRYAPLQIRWAHGDRAYVRAQDIYLRRGVELLVCIGARGKIRQVEVLEVRPRHQEGVPAQATSASRPSEPLPLHHQSHPSSPPAAPAAHSPTAIESAWFAASEKVDLGEMETRGAGLVTWQQNLEQIEQALSLASYERHSLGTTTAERRPRVMPGPQPSTDAMRSWNSQIQSYAFTWQILFGLVVVAAICAAYFVFF